MVRQYVVLYAAFVIDSLATVCGKLASNYPSMSLPFLFWYAADVAVLGVFAIIWQQILKKMPLSVAYSNRPVVTVLGVFYGCLLFSESLSLSSIIGIIVIIAGIWLVSAEKEGKDE